MGDELERMYRSLRPYAFAIAYRMLGSVGEAEDIAQDAFIRLSTADTTEIESPKAYLATITTRLAIDALRSARSRRESYFGPWLPEPLTVATWTAWSSCSPATPRSTATVVARARVCRAQSSVAPA